MAWLMGDQKTRAGHTLARKAIGEVAGAASNC